MLEPKLAYVTVVAPPGIADLTVTDDESGSSALGLGAAVPVDAGIHHLHAIAPGYRAWMTKFEIADGEQRTVEIPAQPGTGAGAAPVTRPRIAVRPFVRARGLELSGAFIILAVGGFLRGDGRRGLALLGHGPLGRRVFGVRFSQGGLQPGVGLFRR